MSNDIFLSKNNNQEKSETNNLQNNRFREIYICHLFSGHLHFNGRAWNIFHIIFVKNRLSLAKQIPTETKKDLILMSTTS